MTVISERSYKRNVEKQRVKAARGLFHEALQSASRVEADMKVCANRMPFFRRLRMGVAIIFGRWK